MREREIAGPPRDGFADSPDGSAEDIDFLMDDIESSAVMPSRKFNVSFRNTNGQDAIQRNGFGKTYRNRSLCDYCA